jgi:Sigma-70 region 2
VASAEEFVQFAEVMSPRLRRTAFLLCGDWHTAEDLAQTALAKVFVSWRKIRRQDAVHAYTTRTPGDPHRAVLPGSHGWRPTTRTRAAAGAWATQPSGRFFHGSSA